MTWTTDNIRMIFAYAIALILIVGGLLFLYFGADNPSPNFQGQLVVVAGFIGAAVQFVFGGAQSSQATKAFQQGVNTTPNGGEIK